MKRKVPVRPGLVAFVFPGQGAQKIGMGQSAYLADERSRAAFDDADRALGEPLSKLCFEGPESELVLTRNTQPAVLASSIALLRALDVVPDVVAGHSLGEYTANVCAGVLSLSDAVRAVRRRGELMQDAVPVGKGAMAAVLKLEREVVESLCAKSEGIVEPVNYNAPGQIVIAGEAQAVAAVSAEVAELGGRAMSLPVSAPFHSSLMRPAEAAFEPVLEALVFEEPTMPIYVNVDARKIGTATEARAALMRQISRPVRWEDSVRRMVEDGVTLFVEIGAGSALTGMISRTADAAAALSVQTIDDLVAAKDAIRIARP